MPSGMRVYAALGVGIVTVFAVMTWAYRELRTLARHKDGEVLDVPTLPDGEGGNSQGSVVANRRPALFLEGSRRGSADISGYGPRLLLPLGDAMRRSLPTIDGKDSIEVA
jgi:hypothetical protein